MKACFPAMLSLLAASSFLAQIPHFHIASCDQFTHSQRADAFH